MLQRRIVELYEAWDKPEKAKPWREELEAIEPAKSDDAETD